MAVFLDEMSERDVYVKLVWIRVFPIDLQLVDCLAADLEVLLLKKKKALAFEKSNHLAVLYSAPEWLQYIEVSSESSIPLQSQDGSEICI